jgi:HAD superfamily hydrolase (TIGR01549 family)
MAIERPKIIVLDVDMTILDSLDFVWGVYGQVAANLDLEPPSIELLKSLWGFTGREIVTGMFGETSADAAYEETKRVNKEADPPPLLPETLSVLQQLLNAGYILGLLSSTDRDLFMGHLLAGGIEESWFELIVGGDEVEFNKPDKRAFDPFLELCQAQKMTYVGDSEDDYQAASKAGLSFLAVLTGITSREVFLAAGLNDDHILDSISDLPQALGINYQPDL